MTKQRILLLALPLLLLTPAATMAESTMSHASPSTPTAAFYYWHANNGAEYQLIVNRLPDNTFTFKQITPYRLNVGHYFVNPYTHWWTFVTESGPDFGSQFTGVKTTAGYNTQARPGTYSAPGNPDAPNGFFILWWATK